MQNAKLAKEPKYGTSLTSCLAVKLVKNCNIGQNVVVSPEVILGNNVKVQNNVSIYTGVICEDDVFLGPSMVFYQCHKSKKCS